MNVCIVGAGYVGLVAGVGLASRGHNVVCVEALPEKVRAISQGVSPFNEPGLQEALGEAVVRGRFRATTSFQDGVSSSDVIFVCVETPGTEDGGIGLSSLKRALRQVASAIECQDDYKLVVIKSTLAPTTADNVIAPLLRECTSKPVGLCVNPEFLREGSALEDFLHPDRIVIGAIDAQSGDVLERVYQNFAAPLVRTSMATAEVIKYTANALLATAISFSNEVANICELIPGVDVTEVMDAVHLDRRLSPDQNGQRVRPGILSYFQAGCGYGGSCLPKDLEAFQAFARSQGYRPLLLEAVSQVNSGRPLRLVKMAESAVGSLQNKRVAVLGLAFKPHTDDMRHSPAIEVVDGLLRSGARVQAYDPWAGQNATALWGGVDGFTYAPSLEEAVKGADVAILVTAWPEFQENLARAVASLMPQPLLIDGRRVFDWREQTSLRYLGVGRYWHKPTAQGPD